MWQTAVAATAGDDGDDVVIESDVCAAPTNATRRLKSRAHAAQLGVWAWQLQ